MLICDLSTLSGLSRQWINKLVDRDAVPGCRRKANGRLEIYDDEMTTEWASRMGDRLVKHSEEPGEEKSSIKKALTPFLRWALRGRSKQSVKARTTAYAFVLFPGLVDEAKS